MQIIKHNPGQMTLIRNTIAKDCDVAEFNLFMEAAKSYGLDPFRTQIIPLVFNKKKAEKRKLSIIVSRDGLRVIAQRCKNYRPASEPAKVVYDADLKGPLNPKGIVSVSVQLWQQDNAGDWYPVSGDADWDEFAPIKDEWAETEQGKWKPTGNKTLDDTGNWCRMPKLMITKCAEAQALRAGWPDQFGGLFVEEEMDKAKIIDLTASEVVDQEAETRRIEAVNGADSIMTWWGENFPLENVPTGKYMDSVLAHMEGHDPLGWKKWTDMNRDGLRGFWAKQPSDALELKQRIEARLPKPVPKSEQVETEQAEAQ